MCVCFFVAPVLGQIDIQMSQYMFNGMTLNPAHAGEHEVLNAQLLTRMQWVGVQGAPNTQVAAVDWDISKYSSGVGVLFVRDAIGGLTNLGVYGNYAYRLRLNEVGDRLCLGLAAGVVQNSYNAYDPYATGGFGQNLYDATPDGVLDARDPVYLPDFRLGMMYDMRDIFYAGLSLNNLGSFFASGDDSISVVQTPVLAVSMGGDIKMNKYISFRPSVLYSQPISRIIARKASGESNSITLFPPAGTLDVSAALLFAERVWVGVSYRMGLGGSDVVVKNAVALLAEVWVTDAIRIGYTYDLALGGMNSVQGGSHEVSIGFTPRKKLTKYKSARDF